MKKFIFFSLCLFSLNCAEAQNQTSVEDGILSLNLLTPGIEYEHGLTNKTTLNLRGGTGFAYLKSSAGNGFEGFGIYPIFNLQYRYYYNFEKRLNKGKVIRNNNGNYIALSGALQAGEPVIGNLKYNTDYFGLVGPVWGLQRYYGSGFKLDLNLGAGYGFNEFEGSYFSPIMGIRLGWLLSN